MKSYIFLQFLKLILIKIPLQLLGYIIVPIQLLMKFNDERVVSANLEGQRFQSWAKWWDSGDPIDRKYGLNGDLNYQKEWLLPGVTVVNAKTFEMSIDLIRNAQYDAKNSEFTEERERAKKFLSTMPSISKWKIFLMRLNWLAVRNPINYFQYHILGIKSSDLVVSTAYENRPSNSVETSNMSRVTQLNVSPYEVGNYPDHYAGYRYSEVELKNTKRIREYYWIIPYKFKKDKCFRARIGYKLGHNPLKPQREYIQWVFTVQPWKDFEGKS